MFKHYINLELKAFRSASVEKHWLKNSDGLLVVYFLLVFLVVGLHCIHVIKPSDQNRWLLLIVM
jgi:hypothetical protein